MAGAQGDGHLFTIATAAAACGVAEVTIKRDLRDRQRFPSARKEPIPGGGGTERWVIPYRDLVAAGYVPNRPRPAEPAEGESRPTPDPDELDRLRRALDDERQRREQAEHRAELAEVMAGERERALSLLERSLRQLEAGPTPPLSDGAPVRNAGNSQPHKERRRRWWPW